MACAGMKLADLVHGLLPEPEADRVREHAAACADCRDAVERLERERAVLSAAASAWALERAAAPPRVNAPRFWRRLTVAASLAICASALWVLMGPSEEEAAALVAKLRSDRVEEREEAARRLKALGEAAVPELRKAAGDPDVEVAGRARRLLETIAVLPSLTPALREALPGLEDRLGSSGGPAWLAAFKEATAADGLGARAHPRLGALDMQPLVLPAFQAADAQERADVLRRARAWGLRLPATELLDSLSPDRATTLLAVEMLIDQKSLDAVPELVRRIVEQPRQFYNPDTVDLLKRLDPAAAVVQLRSRLGVQGGPGKGQILWILGEMKAVDAAGEIRAFAWDPTTETRRCAAFALGNMASPEDIGALLRLSEDRDFNVRGVAIESLARRRAAEAVPALIARLEDPQEAVRIAAAQALPSMGEAGRAAGPTLIRRLREEPVAIVRGALVGAVGRLGIREAWRDVARLLDEQETSVRAYALQALAALGEPAALPEIERRLDSLFKDRTNWLPSATADAIASLAAREGTPGLSAWLGDPRREIRVAVAEKLCVQGSTAGVPVLLKEGDSLFVLVALSEPEVWRRLQQPPRHPSTGTSEEFLAALAAQAGLELDVSEAPQQGGSGGGGYTASTAFEAIDRMLFHQNAQAVVSHGRLRVLDDKGARAYWEAWWRSR